MGMRFVGLDLRDILSLGYQDLPVANLRRIMNTALFLTNFTFLTVSFFYIIFHIDQAQRRGSYSDNVTVYPYDRYIRIKSNKIVTKISPKKVLCIAANAFWCSKRQIFF